MEDIPSSTSDVVSTSFSWIQYLLTFVLARLLWTNPVLENDLFLHLGTCTVRDAALSCQYTISTSTYLMRFPGETDVQVRPIELFSRPSLCDPSIITLH